MKETIFQSLEKILREYDLYGLEQLVQSMTPAQISEYKKELVETYLDMFGMWMYEYDCHRISEENREEFLEDMIAMLDTAEEIDPAVIHYADRAGCYKMLADNAAEHEAQLTYFQKAIDEYRRAVQHPEFVQLNASLANALIDKMALSKQLDEKVFAEAHALFDLAYAEYSEFVMRIFLYSCFHILRTPFETKLQHHRDFIGHFEKSTLAFARKDPLIYLGCTKELTRILRHNYYQLSDEYAEELNTFIIGLLENLTDYDPYTHDQDLLNDLGHEFEAAAKRTRNDTSLKLSLHTTALKYFLRGQTVNPYAWTFPVYATNVLLEMSLIYYADKRQTELVETFEKGRTIFPLMPDPNYTLMINWARFMIEYAKLAYNFDAPELLHEAEEKLFLAKTLGENYYDDPYILLAKIALKLGDSEKCMALLTACKSLFTTKYSIYSLSQVIEDEDFADIIQDKRFILLNENTDQPA